MIATGPSNGLPGEKPMPRRVRLEQLNQLHDRLSAEQRDELLQCLLIAAPRGGEAMVKVLEELLLCHATDELLEEHTLVAGVDGCRAGWFVVMQQLCSGETTCCTAGSFDQVLKMGCQARVIAVDMPIGLPETAEQGGRPVDQMARKRLQPDRGSCVFPAPCRPALACSTYQEAAAVTRAQSTTGRSLSRQVFALFPKLLEVDAAMTPERQGQVYEVHPELCFAAMNGGQALKIRKKTEQGRKARIARLQSAGFDIHEASIGKLAKGGVSKDDVLDAYAACWTARRIARGEAERLPEDPETDLQGLRMEMWF